MKLYQSPLSIVGLLYILLSLYFIWGMFFKGFYPTYSFFGTVLIGLIMLVVDYYLRKSSISLSVKLILQTLIAVVPTILIILFFTGRLK